MLWTNCKCPFTFHTADVLCTYLCYGHIVNAVLLDDFLRRKKHFATKKNKQLCKATKNATSSTTKKIIKIEIQKLCHNDEKIK